MNALAELLAETDVDIENATKEVFEAANWLDVKYPGWVDKIDLGRFSMPDSSACIGAYIGVGWYDLHHDWIKFSGRVSSSVFAWWTPIWRDEIIARRAS